MFILLFLRSNERMSLKKKAKKVPTFHSNYRINLFKVRAMQNFTLRELWGRQEIRHYHTLLHT